MMTDLSHADSDAAAAFAIAAAEADLVALSSAATWLQ
jgi:hypothetical protein